MKRNEYLALFQEQVEREIENSRLLFSQGLVSQGEKLKGVLTDNFREINDLAVAAEKEYVMFFYFSLLKTDVIKRKYTILSQAMDNRWYLDKEMIETSFQLDFLFTPINRLWDVLLNESRQYLGKINHYDIQHIIFSEVTLHNQAIAHFLRYLFKDLCDSPAFNAIPRIPYWAVRWGDYRDSTQIVALLDQSEKSQAQWDEALRDAAGQKDGMANGYWFGARLKESRCEGLVMPFITFAECQLEKIHFPQSDLSEARFIKTHLLECDFSECNLQGADFRTATFEKVNFQGAVLKNAIFSLESLLQLDMTPEQLQYILVEKEEQNALFPHETR